MPALPYLLYTSQPTDGGYRALADFLRAEYQQPVLLLPLHLLPRPAGPQQRLLREQSYLQRELTACRQLLLRYEPFPRLRQELADLREDIRRFEQRLQQIAADLAAGG